MTQPWTSTDAPGLADAGGQVSQLRHVLALVEALAERPQPEMGDASLDEAARISAAYAAALPIDQRRFDRAAWRATAAASAGADALIRLQEQGRPVKAAAARLAEELAQSIAGLADIVSA